MSKKLFTKRDIEILIKNKFVKTVSAKGSCLQRELSEEEKYKRLQAENNLLKAENELLKKLDMLESKIIKKK